MKTSLRQISLFTEETLTSSAEASHASRTAPQAKDWGKMTSDISGPICLDAFGRFPRVGSWGKMFSALLIGQEGWSSTRCRLTWKLKGTKSNRMYFQLQASTLPTKGQSLVCCLFEPTPDSRRWNEEVNTNTTTKKRQSEAKQKTGKRGQHSERPTPHGLRNAPDSDNKLRQRRDESTEEGWQDKGERAEPLGGNKCNPASTNAERLGSPRKEHRQTKSRLYTKEDTSGGWKNFPTQPPICSGDDGLSDRLDNITFPKWRNESIKAYGNAIVPQVAHQIFKAIAEYEKL